MEKCKLTPRESSDVVMGLEIEIRASDSPRHFFFLRKNFLLFFFQSSISFCPLFNFFFKNLLIIYFWFCWISVAARGLLLVSVSQDCSLVMVSGLLTAWASLVGGEQALGMWAQ